MTPLNPVETLIRVASGHTWVKEIGENRGQAVEAILARVGLPPGQPWCAAFVSYIGWLVFRELWPLPLTGGCSALGAAAKDKSLLSALPASGAVFLIWGSAVGRFHHCGFLIGPTASGWQTVEGNTNAGGSPEGTGVFVRQRSFAAADRFIGWNESQR